MYVLMDMEWITNKNGHHCPTQLAALRVDEEWNTVDSFSTLIRPRDFTFEYWNHMAYSGWQVADFRDADKLYVALDSFVNWLHQDDILCWWHTDSNDMYNLFMKLSGVRDMASEVVFLRPYVVGFLSGQKGNPYNLCQAHNIEAPTPMHCSENDVVAMQLLLQGIHFRQEYLLEPPKQWDKEPALSKGTSCAPYLYDPEANTIHRSDCEHLHDGIEYPAFFTLTNPIRRHHKPCSCCRDEFYDALWERNQDIISRTDYNYVYSTRSKVFHSRNCSHVLLSYDIQGTVSYNTCAKKGLRPCKHCKPSAIDLRPSGESVTKKVKKNKPSKRANLTSDERKAIGRFLSAKDERENALRGDLTRDEHNRVMTLTQPGMAFWAAKGHRTFHRRNCAQLNGLNHLRGFARYSDATHAGFAPCRHCKPSKKQDILFSIPITSKERDNDDCSTLVELCTEHCLPHEYDDRYFTMQTMAGKWRIDMSLRPVRLEHINLIRNHGNTTKYHIQPRLFLSLKDTFDYIMRHDSALIEEHQAELDAPALAMM